VATPAGGVLIQALAMKELPVDFSPDEFESQVRDWIVDAYDGPVDFEVTRKEMLEGDGGEYEIDVVAHFTIFGGAAFTVLIECKKHKNPVKRDLVMVLESKLRDIKAQKAMLFSTSGFQSGAIKFAEKHKIALIQVADESTAYLAKAEGLSMPSKTGRYVGWFLYETENESVGMRLVSKGEAQAIGSWLSSNG
jgi:restriction system protein